MPSPALAASPAPGSRPRARARSWAAKLAAALIGALGLLEPEPAVAAEVKVSARTIGEGYVVLGPGSEPQLIRRRRLVQYVNLGVYELLPPTEPVGNLDGWTRPPEQGQLELVVSMRLRHDFGEYVRTASPDAALLVDTLDNRQLDLMVGYLQGRRLANFFDFRVGRQLETSGLDWYAFDGGWARATTPAHLAIEVFAGLQVDGSHIFGWPTWEPDGTSGEEPADRARSPMIGTALALADLRWIHARVAYRRTFTPAAINGSLLEPTGRADGSVQPLQSGVDQELVSATLDLNLLEGKLAPFAAVRFDLGALRLSDLNVGVQTAISDMHLLRLQYLRTVPVFDLDSIFNIFSVQPFQDVRLSYQVRPGGGWTLLGRGTARIFRDTGSPASPEPRRSIGWGGALAAAWQKQRFAVRTDAFVQGGEGGTQAGGSIDSQIRVLWDRIGIDLRSYFARYLPDPDDTRGRDGWGWSVQAGTDIQVWKGIHVTLLAEELLTPSLRPSFRGLAVLAVDWSFRAGRRRP